MASSNMIKLLSAVVFLMFISKGNCQCTLSELTISQSQTGDLVKGKPQWNTTITNPCPCSVVDVNLDCTGFQSVESLDPLVLAVTGNKCLVNNGNPIYPQKSFSFTYAWEVKYDFEVVLGEVQCS